MQLSIIIPVFNAEKYIQRCFGSIIEDSNLIDFEIIFINDGSTDDSLKILNGIHTNNPNVFIKVLNQMNKGQSAARNCGAENAIGKYIFFLDADDFIDNYQISTLLNQAISQDLDTISFLYKCVDFNFNLLSNTISHKLKFNILMTGEEAINTGFQPSSACLFLYKNEFIKKNKLYFIENLLSEDVEFTIRVMLCAEKVLFTEKKSYTYYFSAESTKRTKSEEKIHKFLFDQITVAKLIKENIENYPKIEEKTKQNLIKLSNKGVFSILLVFWTHYYDVKVEFVRKCFIELKINQLYPINNHLDSNFQKILKPVFNQEKIYFWILKIIKKHKKTIK